MLTSLIICDLVSNIRHINIYIVWNPSRECSLPSAGWMFPSGQQWACSENSFLCFLINFQITCRMIINGNGHCTTQLCSHYCFSVSSNLLLALCSLKGDEFFWNSAFSAPTCVPPWARALLCWVNAPFSDSPLSLGDHSSSEAALHRAGCSLTQGLLGLWIMLEEFPSAQPVPIKQTQLPWAAPVPPSAAAVLFLSDCSYQLHRL